MTYSKIINIETKLLNINYEFEFSKPFKFRFITKNNLNGIELNETKLTKINNTDTGKNNWYLFNSDIDFSPLNKYKYLILQLYSDEIINEDVKISKSIDSSYFITNKNSWYNCKDLGANCGIIVKDSTIDSNKAVQELDSDMLYSIEGSATLIKSKYLKTGNIDSVITVSGIKPNIINYIGKFKLHAKGKKVTNNKNPISVNKYSEFIDNKLFPINNSSNNEINSINSRIEMIKFQLKNYFIENDKQIDLIESNINKNSSEFDDKVDKVKNEIIEIDKRIIELKKRLDDSNLDEFMDNEILIRNEVLRLETLLNAIINENNNINKKLNTSILENNQFKGDINSKIDSNFNSLNEKQINIDVKVKDIDSKIEENSKEDLEKFNEISNRLTNLKSQIDNLKNVQEFLLNKEENNLIWSNLNNVPYKIDYHRQILNLDFIIESKTYSQTGLYLFEDCTGLIIPYFCIKVKEVTFTRATARLAPLSSIHNFY